MARKNMTRTWNKATRKTLTKDESRLRNQGRGEKRGSRGGLHTISVILKDLPFGSWRGGGRTYAPMAYRKSEKGWTTTLGGGRRLSKGRTSYY